MRARREHRHIFRILGSDGPGIDRMRRHAREIVLALVLTLIALAALMATLPR